MIKKTKAAILYELNKPLKIEELKLPRLEHGQVLVKVMASGVCHSQLNEIEGKKGPDKYLPHLLGHEGAGVVEEISDGVTKVKPGDHVVLTWIKGRGLDRPSSTYLDGDTVINSGAISTFSEFTVVSENRVVPISRDMPFDNAALLGCAVPTGAGIVFNTIKPKSGSSIAVFGVGGIGASALIAAKTAGCGIIIAVDIHEFKLQAAKKMGASVMINAAKDDVTSAIMDLTGGQGIDYAIEAAGLKQTMEQAFVSVKDNGGLLVIAGNLSQGQKISIDPFDLIKGKRIIGSWGGQTLPDEDIPKYVNLYLEEKLKIDELITHRFSLDEINDAFRALKTGDNVLRIILEC